VNETWWVNIDQLDERQKEILVEPPESELLVVGPPGSGKTNILMLRANYVRYVGPRVLFLTFTRSLAEFLRSGASVGRADQNQQTDIKTYMGWARGVIVEHGSTPPDESGNFDADRRAMVARLKEVVDGQQLGQLYDFAFVDDVQDFWESELTLVRWLAARINASGDSRQRIWSHREGLASGWSRRRWSSRCTTESARLFVGSPIRSYLQGKAQPH
jgi:superfamily I DNA/RNA helicase